MLGGDRRFEAQKSHGEVHKDLHKDLHKSLFLLKNHTTIRSGIVTEPKFSTAQVSKDSILPVMQSSTSENMMPRCPWWFTGSLRSSS